MSESKQFTARIADILPGKRDLIEVSCYERVGIVLDMLEQNHITSVPVYGTKGGWIGAGNVDLTVGDKQYIGIVSSVDLLHFVMRGSDAEERMHRPVVEAIGSTHESKCLWVEPVTQFLYVAMERFCKGTHYALAIDGAPTATHVPMMISQTDVLKYLLQNVMSMPVLQKKLGETIESVFTRDVVAVGVNAPLSEALAMLTIARAVPVADENGNLISTLSVSDFRGTFSALVGALIPMTVHEFLAGQHGGNIPLPITATTVDTIGYAAQRMIDNHIHRVWVVQPGFAHELSGVITMTDVIGACFGALLQHAPTPIHVATDIHMPKGK